LLNLREHSDRVRAGLKRLLESPTGELGRWGRLAVYQIRLWRFCGRQLRRDRLVTVAGDLTFKTLLSFIPIFVIFLLFISIFSPGVELETQVQELLLKAVQADGIRMTVGSEEVGLQEYIKKLVGTARLRIDTAAITGIVFLFLLAINVLMTMEGAVNTIWHIEKRRSLWRKLLMFWLILTLAPLAAVVAVYGIRYLADEAATVAPWLLVVGEWSVGLAAAWFVLFIFYKLLPNREVKWRSALTGAVVAGLLWHVIAKTAFAIYLRHATGYGTLYGNLAVIPLFFLWIYVTWIFVLFGAELAYVIQNFKDLARAEADEEERRRGRFLAADFAALVVASVCARRFRRGEGPTPIAQLIDATGLGQDGLEEILGRMESAGLVARTPVGEAEAYLPAREPSRMRVADVMRAARSRLPSPADADYMPIHREARAVYEALRSADRDPAARTTVADLVDRADAPPAERKEESAQA
jgi:membrane protein